jgi:hypothetical protein
MRFIIILNLLVLAFSNCSGQQDISVFKKKDGEKNINSTGTASDEGSPGANEDSTDLIVFFRPGCSRCETFRMMLDENCIHYTSVDMSTDDPRIPQMWKDIQIQGFNGGTIHYPIIRHHGKVIWDMIDMNAFIERLQR